MTRSRPTTSLAGVLSSGSHLRAFRVLRAARRPLASAVGAPRGISPLRRLRRHEWSPVDRTVVISLLAIAFGCLFLPHVLARAGRPGAAPHRRGPRRRPGRRPGTVDASKGSPGKARLPRLRLASGALARDRRPARLRRPRPDLGATDALRGERGRRVGGACAREDLHGRPERAGRRHAPARVTDPNGLDIFYLMLVATIIGFITVFQIPRAMPAGLRCAIGRAFVVGPSRSRRRSSLTLVDGAAPAPARHAGARASGGSLRCTCWRWRRSPP